MSEQPSLLGRLLREPLAHFLAAGVVLFAVLAALGREAPVSDDGVIVVDRAALLAHMQYRANAFEPEAFGALFDSMTEEERQALIDDYVKEEALYREAQALGLGESDYIIRQRMIQKMNFLMGDLAVAGEAVDEAVLADYFARNREAYAAEPSVTFTHVFFDSSRRGEDAAEQAAREALVELTAAGAGFNDATGVGDRFPFLKNYVERTFDYVATHFGENFVEALARLPEPDGRWHGPIPSAYGWHLVYVSARTPRSYPELADVRDQVEADYRREASEDAVDRLTEGLLDRYRVEVRDLAGEAAP
jgi:parvulin-like peptidyl-prolyl isomerase